MPFGRHIEVVAPVGKRFYTIKDLIDMGYASRTTIWRRIRASEIKAIRHGDGVLIPRDDFEAYLDGLIIKGVR